MCDLIDWGCEDIIRKTDSEAIDEWDDLNHYCDDIREEISISLVSEFTKLWSEFSNATIIRGSQWPPLSEKGNRIVAAIGNHFIDLRFNIWDEENEDYIEYDDDGNPHRILPGLMQYIAYIKNLENKVIYQVIIEECSCETNGGIYTLSCDDDIEDVLDILHNKIQTKPTIYVETILF